MVKVNMPRAQWESVILALEEIEKCGISKWSLLDNIRNQVYSQEY